MADGERRMLFDTRGKRKHVIRVVYAILALLMGASLFLVVGPFNLAELTGGSSGSSASEVFREQAENVEKRLAKDPQNEQMLLTLTRARINAGTAEIEAVAETEAPTVSTEGRKEFTAALEAWNRYLKQAGDEPSATGAQLVGLAFFRLAEAGTTVPEVAESVATATRAQRIAAEQRPSINSLSTLAIYEYFNGEFAAGDKTAKRAAAEAASKAEAKAVEKQLAEYRKNSQAFAKQKKEVAKSQGQAGKEALQNPFGLGGTTPGG
ncbi:MAG: hypothetical protein ABW196_06485 [Solirubrobacterales bacterium]